jgi:hypothetical protein
MILLDWTRMGHVYCLAGAVAGNSGFRIVRPLPFNQRSPTRNVGWSPFLFDGHTRWEVFELVGAESTEVQLPHVEDLWVRALRPRRRLASPDERIAILTATTVRPAQPIFGAPLVANRGTVHLPPGTGQRSLATVVVQAHQVHFTVSQRVGAAEADFRVTLDAPEVAGRYLPLKDHHLLQKTRGLGNDLEEQVAALRRMVQQMGAQVAVRLGLSRAFQATTERGPGVCWPMADGFFSLSNPEP